MNYRLGQKQKRAILDQNGNQVALFEKGQEALAELVVFLLDINLSKRGRLTSASNPSGIDWSESEENIVEQVVSTAVIRTYIELTRNKLIEALDKQNTKND